MRSYGWAGRSRTWVTAIFVVVLFSYSTSRLYALSPALSGRIDQTQAAAAPGIQGTVTDPDNRVVVGAAVLIRNEATNQIKTTTTDSAGHFSFDGLPAGTYAVEVS